MDKHLVALSGGVIFTGQNSSVELGWQVYINGNVSA